MQITDTDTIEVRYRNVYLSPHFDDAAISCGGGIAGQAARGERVLVVTLFGGEPAEDRRANRPALRPLTDVKRRRQEDRRAMEVLGADYLWLDYRDAVFRQRPALTRYGLHLGARDIERTLFEKLLASVEAICERSGAGRLYVPLGIGQHRDHQIAFQIGRHVSKGTANDIEVIFYEDLPYAFVPGMRRYRAALGGLDLDPDPARAARGTGETWRGNPELYRLLTGLPTLRLDSRLLRPLVSVSVAVLDAVAGPVLRAPNNAAGVGRLREELLDVTDRMAVRCEAIARYASQMSAHGIDEQTYLRFHGEYSAMAGCEPGRYVERYWRRAGAGEGAG
jgi:LmbE family N-acetylglucosaminyl deacetylase